MLTDYEIFPKAVLGDKLYHRFNKSDSFIFAKCPYPFRVNALRELFFPSSEAKNEQTQVLCVQPIVIDDEKYEHRRFGLFGALTDDEYANVFQRLVKDPANLSKPRTWKELSQLVPNVGIPTAKILCHVIYWLQPEFTHSPAKAFVALASFSWVGVLRDGPFATPRKEPLRKFNESPYEAALAFVNDVCSRVDRDQIMWNEKCLQSYVSLITMSP